jgi:hypothetical protein
MRSSLTGSGSGSVVNILTENQIPIFSDGYHPSGNQNSISMFLLANSIPLAKSACKAPAQVSDHLFQAASSDPPALADRRGTRLVGQNKEGCACPQHSAILNVFWVIKDRN